jgi:catechol 2,3-dioxygenase-like lactoylglutathione lyase family enzyme
MIHHVSLAVSDLERSAAFYDALLSPLGWRRQVDQPRAIGYGLREPVFFIGRRGQPHPGEGHVCFAASGSPAVKAAYEAGIDAGGRDDGGPGSRPQYGPGYYSAYLLDPDGYRVEVAVSVG